MKDSGWNKWSQSVGKLGERIVIGRLGLRAAKPNEDFRGVDAWGPDGCGYQIKADQRIAETGNIYLENMRVPPYVAISDIRDDSWKARANTAQKYAFVTNGGKFYVVGAGELARLITNLKLTLVQINPTSMGWKIPLEEVRKLPGFVEYDHGVDVLQLADFRDCEACGNPAGIVLPYAVKGKTQWCGPCWREHCASLKQDVQP